MAKLRYLYIDIDTSKSSDEEMKQVFQQVFGTGLYTTLARCVYKHRSLKRYHYNYMGLNNTVWGDTTETPIEVLDANAETIALSSILFGGTSIGEL